MTRITETTILEDKTDKLNKNLNNNLEYLKFRPPHTTSELLGSRYRVEACVENNKHYLEFKADSDDICFECDVCGVKLEELILLREITETELISENDFHCVNPCIKAEVVLVQKSLSDMFIKQNLLSVKFSKIEQDSHEKTLCCSSEQCESALKLDEKDIIKGVKKY